MTKARPGRPLMSVRCTASIGPPFVAAPSRKRTALSRPRIGRSAACLTPPPSVISTTSGASTSISALQVAGLHSEHEPVEDRLALPGAHLLARLTGLDVVAGAVGDLAHGGGRLVHGVRDLVVPDVEDLAQHEHRPLGRRQGLEHHEHRGRDAVGELDVLGHVGRGEQRLGQPRPDVRLALARQGAQPVQREPGGDPHQVGPLVADLGVVDLGPAQPGLLQHVLGVGGRAEHLVGDREQQVPVRDERVGARRAQRS